MESRLFGLLAPWTVVSLEGRKPRVSVKTEWATQVSFRKVMGLPPTLTVILDSWG